MLISLSSVVFASCKKEGGVTDYDKVYPDRVVNTYSFDIIGGQDVMPIGLYYGPYTPNGSENGNTMPNFTDEYYIKMLSEVGINLFTYRPEVYPQASESIKKVLTLAEKYNIGYYRSLLFNEDGTPTARTGKILAATPMKKFGEISDLIGTLMWLADDNASGFVTSRRRRFLGVQRCIEL